MPHFHDQTVRKGIVLFSEGDLADKIFIITEGEFEVSKKSKNVIEDNEKNL